MPSRILVGAVAIGAALVFAACATGAISDDPCSGEACGEEGGRPDSSGADTSRPTFDADFTPDAEGDGGQEAGGDAGTLRVMTFAIEHASVSSVTTIANAIKAETPDIVGLENVDVNTTRSGSGVDQPAQLATQTGLEKGFQAAIPLQGGFYGLALLSRFPIMASDRVLLTSTGEQRILAVFTLEMAAGKTITAAVTHLSTVPAERAKQSMEIVTALAGKPRVILFATMNEPPGQPAVQIVTSALNDAWTAAGHTTGGETYPSGSPPTRIDYVFLAKEWAKPTGATVPTGTTSNHRPVVVAVPSF